MAAGSNTTIAKISGRAKPSAMACPRCGSTLNGVTETRTQSDNSIRRKRTCASCRGTWMTAERALSPGPGASALSLGCGPSQAMTLAQLPIRILVLWLHWRCFCLGWKTMNASFCFSPASSGLRTAASSGS